MCLVMDTPTASDQVLYQPITAERVREINLCIVICAHRTIYAAEQSAEVEGLINTVGIRGIEVGVARLAARFLELGSLVE